jgi:hypothetical protein
MQQPELSDPTRPFRRFGLGSLLLYVTTVILELPVIVMRCYAASIFSWFALAATGTRRMAGGVSRSSACCRPHGR